MRALPPLDLHAHIDPEIADVELENLGAVIFAVTRSLTEATQVLTRRDLSTVWGVGCHPGLVGPQTEFSADLFSTLIDQTAFVGEIGLDGKSMVPLDHQRENLRLALEVLATKPRIVSLHSYAATAELIGELEAIPIRGAVLHWWLGDAATTERAIQLGCYFSVNASSVRKRELLGLIPADRLLSETDHPFGDRHSKSVRAPGRVADVESGLAKFHGMSVSDVRMHLWRNLGRLTRGAGCSHLLPRNVRSWIAAVV